MFTASISGLYEEYLVPLIFEPYAADLVDRLAEPSIGRVLEIAAGTGVVTRKLAAVLPPRVSIVATDLSEPMLETAATIGTARSVEWRQADAMQLPFPDATFDAVVCQFGAMFFPDRAGAFSEVRRVLRPGGIFVFSVWDRLAENDFADVVTRTLDALCPEDPPRFLARIPHGYHDPTVIAGDLARGGLTARPDVETVAARSRAASARIPAIAYCQGTPLRGELEARGVSLGDATDAVAVAIARRFGPGAVDGKIQAHVVTTRA